MSNHSNLEAKNIFEYVSYSVDDKDFLSRINAFLNIVLMELSCRVEQEMFFPFHSVEIVDSVNHDAVNIINEINSTPIIENQPKIDVDIVMKIIESHCKQLNNQYHYYKKITHLSLRLFLS